jgi:hypothetical protein
LPCSAPAVIQADVSAGNKGRRKRPHSFNGADADKCPANSQIAQLKRAKTRQATKGQSVANKQTDEKLSIKSNGDIVVAVSASPEPDGIAAVAVGNNLISELVKLTTVVQQQQQKITDLEQQLCTILSILGDIANKQQDQLHLQLNDASTLNTSVLPLLKDIAAKQQDRQDQLGLQQNQARTTDVPATKLATLQHPHRRPATRLLADVVAGRGGRSGRTGGRAGDDGCATSVPVADVGGDGDNDELGHIDSQFTLVVHRTLNDVSRRSKNIIISGLPEESDTGTSDRTTVNEFTAAFFQIKPALSAGRCCRRIGKPSADRPRRLLVHLESEQAAAELLKEAPRLRHANDSYIAEHVFINADLSPSAAKLAYEARQRRRDRRRSDRTMDTECRDDTEPVSSAGRGGDFIADSPAVAPDITDVDGPSSPSAVAVPTGAAAVPEHSVAEVVKTGPRPFL